MDAPKKLVTLQSPSVGFTGARIKNGTRLTRNYYVSAGGSLQEMVSQVQQGDRHVVFNCHGHPKTKTQPPYLELGTSLHEGNADIFQPWQYIGSLRVIWLSACNIGGSGLPFCQKLARLTGCYVVSNITAVYDRPVSLNTIEDNYFAMPIYTHPYGKDTSREDFIALGGELGFRFQQ